MENNLLWPIPGFYEIDSYFGKNNREIAFNKGIDITAPQGTPYIAVTDGIITFAGFLGGGGYTVTLTDSNTQKNIIKYTYCHSDPNFIVSVGEMVHKGQIIGYVGPRNVQGVKGNQYFDENENPTNGSLKEPHLHFGMRINGIYVDPLNYL